jgi:hypothetical protein
MNKRMANHLLKRLATLKSQFDPAATGEKLELLKTLAGQSLRETKQIIKYHDDLCFIQAYPDNKVILTEVNRALSNFSKIIDQIGKKKRENDFENTGIVGSTISYAFSYQTAEWLYRHYSEDITISWEYFDQQDILLEFLQALISPFEAPALDDMNLNTEAWIKFVASQEGKTDFHWLLHKIVQSGVPERDLEAIYELMDIPLNWNLGLKTVSRTIARIPLAKTFYQVDKLSNKRLEMRKHVRLPIDAPILVSVSKGRKLIGKSISDLAIRSREIYPLFFANPKDVWMINLDRAITFIFIGMKPLRRFPLESEYFFLGLKNNIPITYGSGTICIDQIEVAANIFNSFRQGESVFIYAQLMRTFHQMFKTRSFLVQKFQIGAEENEDALKSGAFWFYYKLGFRPIDKDIAIFAEREDKKRQRVKGYRSPLHVLEKLATSDMRFFVTGKSTPADKLCLPGLALLMSKYRGAESNSPKIVRDVCKVLHIDNFSQWSGAERYWFEQFGPLLMNIPDLSHWTKSELKDLGSLVKSKGRPSELEFIHGLMTHKRFLKVLFSLSKKGQKILPKLMES